MQHFQSILIVIGLLAIGGVIIHGYLLSRKDKLAVAESTSNDIFAEKLTPEIIAEPVDEILGEVRIISSNVDNVEEDIDFSLALNEETDNNVNFTKTKHDSQAELKTDNGVDTDEVVEGSALADTIDNTLCPDTSELDCASNEALLEDADQPQDLFIFNVVAKGQKLLGGHELLQFFLTSGFRFGDMSIFHRHEHSDGTGPILFSIANMMAPGVFDPETMEQFKSEGVSFFLTAPNKNINVKTSFEMMLRAVEQMAEEFDCSVLNAQREPMTQEQFIEFKNRLLHYI